MSEPASEAPATLPLASFDRDFRLYAVGQAVSIVGDRVATIALVFLVIRLSHAFPLAVALYYVCRVLPTLLGGLIVGALADHFSRRPLMIGSDLGRACLVAAIPVLGVLHFLSIFPAVFVLYAFTLVFDTSARAALPDIIDEDRMLAANSILHGIDTAGDFAYAIGGALVFALGLQVPFYIDAATFLFSALMVSQMRLPSHPPQPLPGVLNLVGRVRGGATFLFGQPFLKWSTIAFTFAPLAGGAVYVLMPLYANSTLARSALLFGPLSSGAFRFSVLEVCFGAGALLGAAAAARAAGRWPRGTVFGMGLAGSGVAFALMSLATNVYVACAVLIAAGACNSLFLVAGLTLVQTLTPTEVRGRVVAARMTIINGSLAVGSALGGTLLLGLPYRPAWILLGGIVCASSLFVWLRPDVRGQT